LSDPADTAPPRARGDTQGAGLAAVILAATGFSWGFIIVKAVPLSAPVLAAWRLGVGAAVLVAVALALRLPWGRLGTAALAGVAFGVHQLLFIEATKLTAVAIVTLLGAAQPLLVALGSRPIARERVPAALWLMAGLALLGIGVVVQANLGHESRSLAGDLLAIANVFAFTAYFLLGKRARTGGAHTVTFTASMLVAALLVVLPFALFAGFEVPAATSAALIVVLALGPGNGHLLLNWAHRRISAALGSLVLAAIPLMAGLWAHLVLGEPYTWRHIVGMLLVASAIEGGRRIEARHTRAASRQPVDPSSTTGGASPR
jgi:drug/metabolite transporter (DMT)-like permease